MLAANPTIDGRLAALDGERAPGDLVFAVHQGSQFLCFRTGGSDDPEVLTFEEGAEGLVRVAKRFSEWLLGCVEDEIREAQALG